MLLVLNRYKKSEVLKSEGDKINISRRNMPISVTKNCVSDANIVISNDFEY